MHDHKDATLHHLSSLSALGPRLFQDFHNRVVTVLASQHQSCVTINVNHVDISPCLDEGLHHSSMTPLASYHQSCDTIVVRLVDISPCLDEGTPL